MIIGPDRSRRRQAPQPPILPRAGQRANPSPDTIPGPERRGKEIPKCAAAAAGLALSALGPGNWAVGSTDYETTTLILRWNGTSWS